MAYYRQNLNGVTMNAILLNTAESAEVLRISTITLHRWRLAGKGPVYVEMGRKVYYRRADLERWVDEQRRKPAKSLQLQTTTPATPAPQPSAVDATEEPT